MATTVRAALFALTALTLRSQAQEQNIQSLNVLIGKQVIAQRIPLCSPGTFTTVLTYAGKQATVVSLKPYKPPYPISQSTLNRMPPQARAMTEDSLKAATLLVKFEDGTTLDTCGPTSPRLWTMFFELVPGQALEPSTPIAAPVAATASPVTSAPLATMPPGTALTDVLSDDEVKLALSGKGKDHWVSLQPNYWDLVLMGDAAQDPELDLFMPDAVLSIRAESARKQFIRYEPEEEDKRRSLMIVAKGYVGKTVAQGCTSITRVVLLSDASGGVVQEAYLSEPLSETWQNGFGAKNQCQSLRVKFSLADVHKVRAAAPNGEFLVAVFAGSVNTKMYTVKKKHQSKLGLR